MDELDFTHKPGEMADIVAVMQEPIIVGTIVGMTILLPDLPARAWIAPEIHLVHKGGNHVIS